MTSANSAHCQAALISGYDFRNSIIQQLTRFSYDLHTRTVRPSIQRCPTIIHLLVTLSPQEVVLDGEADKSRTILMYKCLGEFEEQ
jgi:hypothetical protein